LKGRLTKRGTGSVSRWHSFAFRWCLYGSRYGTSIRFLVSGQKIYDEKFETDIVNVKLLNGSTMKEPRSYLFVKHVRNLPKEAVKQEIGDIFEEVNYKMEINCMFLDILKLHLILQNYQKRPSNSRCVV
jgi:hypothetical protein